MPGATYKYVEMVGTSAKSVEDAIASAIAEAAKSIPNIYWFEVTETRGKVENGAVVEYQVSLRLGSRLG